MSVLKQISCMYDVYKRSYINVFDLHFQSQPSRSGDWLAIRKYLFNNNNNMRSSTLYMLKSTPRAMSATCMQPEIRNVIQ